MFFSMMALTAVGTPMPAAGADRADAVSTPARGLVLWLDAADPRTLTVRNGEVVRWSNKAPGFRNALTVEAGRRPRYLARPGGSARPAVRFDGMDDVLRDLRFGRSCRTWTLVVVAAPYPHGGGGLCSAVPAGGNDYDPGFTVDLFRRSSAFDMLNVEGAGRIGGQKDQKRSAHPFGSPQVVVVERDAAEVRLFVNGVAEESRPVQDAVTVMEELRIGARRYGGAERQFFAGEIAEVLLYERALTPDERATLEASRRISDTERRAWEEDVTRNKPERMRPPEVIASWPTVEAYAAAHPDETRPARLPVRKDIKEAVALGMRHLTRLFDRDRDDEPFFYSNRRADGTGEMHHSVNIGIPHVVGRCLLGCMAGEEATGVPFPPEGLAILERYLRRSFDNPDHLNSYDDPARENRRFVEFHNMREGLYGLLMLARGRRSAWAAEKARQMLRTLDALTDEQGAWSVERARALGMADRCEGLSVPNAARMVDPLLEYHRHTGDPLALKLAGLYARRGLKEMFEPDGRFAPMARSSGHVHSITSALSGITRYALFVGDAEMVRACKRIMDRGVPEYFSTWGWGDEVYPDHPADEIGRGEINQTGDVIRTALALGAAGEPRFYELAERYLRSMLLPTQHRERELRKFLKESRAPRNDSERDVLLRTVGGYSMQLPNDRMREGDWPLSTLDITSGAVHALSECWRHRVTREGETRRVNLLFDYDGDDLTVQSGLPVKGEIRFTAKAAMTLQVRVPEWVDPGTLALMVNSRKRVSAVHDGYVEVAGLKAGDRGILRFAVSCRTERETVDGTEYTTTWIGNQVIRIEPRGRVSPLPF